MSKANWKGVHTCAPNPSSYKDDKPGLHGVYICSPDRRQVTALREGVERKGVCDTFRDITSQLEGDGYETEYHSAGMRKVLHNDELVGFVYYWPLLDYPK